MAHVQKHAEQVGGRINGQNWWKRPMEVIVQEAQPQRRYVTNTSVQVIIISYEMRTVIRRINLDVIDFWIVRVFCFS